jgi:hypothetical protein
MNFATVSIDFKDDPYQSKYDFDLIKSSEKDCLSLIWLSKVKLQ